MPRALPLLLALATGAAGLTLAAPAGAQTAATPAPGASTAAAAPEPSSVPGQLLVGWAPGASDADKDRARGRAAAVRQDDVVVADRDRVGVELVRLPQGKDRRRAITELQADPTVAYAEPNWVYTRQALTSSDQYLRDGRLWGLTSAPFGTGATDAWAAGTSGSKGVYVGIIDEGVQVKHPDLDGNIWTNPLEKPGDRRDNDSNGYVDDVHGWDFASNDGSVYDGGTRGTSDDHGTHVAGTIGAENDGAGVVGMNHDVTMISAKFLGPRGGTLDAAVKAVDYFTALKKRGINIVATNNSWGGGGYSQALLDAIGRGAKEGILFVAAAGNARSDNDQVVSYPSNYDTTAAAGYDAVIAVAAIDSAGALAEFSQYGARTVDLGAPGVGVWSTTTPGTHESYNGTSMATPHVTGAVALYKAKYPSATAREIRAALLTTAVPTSSLLGRTSTGGRLNVANALTGTKTPSPTSTPSLTVVQGTTDAAGYREHIVQWSGFVGAELLVDANGYRSRTPNDGELRQGWSAGTVTWTLCETDGTSCVTASLTT